jgi:predicted N-acyltransferase
MRTRITEAIGTIPTDDWNALLADRNPFLRHEFLGAIEASGCASPETGWLPCHVLCESDEGALLGALPLYLKNNSQGEFVFDFAWANAYHQAGLPYYPKLVCAVPFTPATGRRLLVNPAAGADDSKAIRNALMETALQLARDNDASSLHVLFPEAEEIQALEDHDLMLRKDCQFHWHNRDYADFDEFLGTFTSSKRKKTRRERRRITESGIHFETRHGNEIDAELWEQIIPLYNTTFLRRGRAPYLNRECLERIARSMPESMVVFLGYRGEEMVATAICFRSDETLYGRYWGANQFIDSLHFETCYYQGIEYCIDEGLKRFEPGTQGEHKISRGFVPVQTWSAHWLSHPQFAAAIDNYLQRERAHIEKYMDVIREHVPYRGESG